MLPTGFTKRVSRPEYLFFAVCVASILFPFSIPARSQHQDMPQMDGMPGMDHGSMGMKKSDGVASPGGSASQPRSSSGSEFNHHLAGVLVFFAGLFVLIQGRVSKRWSQIRYLWPLCFLAAGTFVLIFSDMEIWPFGSVGPWYALTHDFEVLQHKIFALILLSVGYVELERLRGRLGRAWALYFPVLAIGGATLLLFHTHGMDMSVPGAMKTMQHIEIQHRWFAATGFGIAIAKGLSEVPLQWQRVFARAWPLLLSVLGILLMVYTE